MSQTANVRSSLKLAKVGNAEVVVLSVHKATPFLYILPYHVEAPTARLNTTV